VNVLTGLIPKQLKEVLNVAAPNTIPIKQPTLKPVPKVAAVGVGGVAATLIVVMAKRLLKIDVPPDVATGIVAIALFGFGFATKDRKAK
jgi:hypothetical protein